MTDAYASIIAQVIPVLLLAGVIEWPRTWARMEAFMATGQEKRRQAARAERAMLTDAEVYARHKADHDARKHWLRLGMFRVSARVSIVSFWFYMVAVPAVMLLAEVRAVALLNRDGAPGVVDEVLITSGFTLAIVYIAVPLLVRAATDAATTVSGVSGMRREYLSLLSEQGELLERQRVLLAERDAADDD